MPIASFIITFREALEAALILGIVAAYLKKTGRTDANRYLYLGTASAIGAASRSLSRFKQSTVG